MNNEGLFTIRLYDLKGKLEKKVSDSCAPSLTWLIVNVLTEWYETNKDKNIKFSLREEKNVLEQRPHIPLTEDDL